MLDVLSFHHPRPISTLGERPWREGPFGFMGQAIWLSPCDAGGPPAALRSPLKKTAGAYRFGTVC
jgi:hypothetical protein